MSLTLTLFVQHSFAYGGKTIGLRRKTLLMGVGFVLDNSDRMAWNNAKSISSVTRGGHYVYKYEKNFESLIILRKSMKSLHLNPLVLKHIDSTRIISM